MESFIHVVHYIDSLGIGGAQSMLFELYHGLNKYYGSYLKQQIWLGNPKCFAKEFIDSYGIKYHVVKHKEFERTIESFTEPVIVMYHKLMCSKTQFYQHACKKVPIIVVNHTFTKNTSLNKIEPADLVICVSNHMKSFLRKKLSRQRMSVVINGIDNQRYLPVVPRKSPYSDDIFLTGRINSFNTIKYSKSWLQFCLDAKLPKRMVHEYIGNGMYFDKAERYLAERQNSDKSPRNEVKLLGRIRDFNEKVSIIKNWDVFLYEVNRDEGVSISILEALACGVPVICSDHYGNKEIIEPGINGFVFKDKDEATSILSRLVSRPDELDRLKRSTLQHFKDKLDIKYVAEQYVERISDLSNRVKIPKELKKIVKTESKEYVPAQMDIQIISEANIKAVEVSQNKNPLFSILTATRNVFPYIDNWGASILKQSYRPLEVIFVDDNSVDGTFNKVVQKYNEFKQAGIDLKIIRNEKRFYCGTSYAIAWENSSGVYCGVLDGDDMLMSGVVDYIVNLYEKYPNITYIYTQFMSCDVNMKEKKKGFCCAPNKGESLLDLGRRRIHAFSHWRTFSKRFPKLDKIWGRGLRAGIDKYMGYRLEEFGAGMFVDKICYKYRWFRPGCISKTEKAIAEWQHIIQEATWRRKKYNIKPYPIITYENK